MAFGDNVHHNSQQIANANVSSKVSGLELDQLVKKEESLSLIITLGILSILKYDTAFY